VLFADVRGYTSLTEGLAPAEVTVLMNRFYETASSALLSADGLLGQVEGDNVMGLFVPGLAGAEYRRRSVAGGVALIEAVRADEQLGQSLNLGIGIATGQEFVGNVGGGGYKDFTALGDVTNTAARLTAQAAPGELLLDAETYLAVSSEFPNAVRDELELKGKSASVEAFRIAV
jgi:adenylate cyclase